MHKYIFKIYIHSHRHKYVVRQLRQICERHFAGKYELIIVDVLEYPELTEQDKIIVTPTLIRLFPPPPIRIIGDLHNEELVLSQIRL